MEGTIDKYVTSGGENSESQDKEMPTDHHSAQPSGTPADGDTAGQVGLVHCERDHQTGTPGHSQGSTKLGAGVQTEPTDCTAEHMAPASQQETFNMLVEKSQEMISKFIEKSTVDTRKLIEDKIDAVVAIVKEETTKIIASNEKRFTELEKSIEFTQEEVANMKEENVQLKQTVKIMKEQQQKQEENVTQVLKVGY